MREILFRGKRSNGEWVYGWYYQLRHDKDAIAHYIVENPLPVLQGVKEFEVIPTTIGQFTGLCDKKGKKIFENDIVTDGTCIAQIVWNDTHSWGCKIIKGCTLSIGLTFPLWQWDQCEKNAFREFEIIGNIYDNPEFVGAES